MEKTYKASEWEDARNDHKRHNPNPGDYWQGDMFTPVLVVLAVVGGFVTVCSATKDAGDNKWTWDLTKPRWMDRTTYENYLEGCHFCGSHQWAVKEFQAAAVLAESKRDE